MSVLAIISDCNGSGKTATASALKIQLEKSGLGLTLIKLSSTSDNSEVENKICHVLKADWKDEGDKLFFIIRANRFLQHMVRYLVGTMLEVARGKYDFFNFLSLVENDEKRVKVVRAPAKGLFLKKVYYE